VATITEMLFNFILEDKDMHMATLIELSPEKRQAVVGRKGKIIVTGTQGGVFIVRLTPVGIFRDEDESDLRNEVLMDYDTLREIIIWLAQLGLPESKKDPMFQGMDPRSAYANGYIRISGDKVLYDAEEILAALEKHAFMKMQPIARYALGSMRKEEKG